MKSLLFNIVAEFFAWVIRTVDQVAFFLRTTLGKIGYFLMNCIDSDRCKQAESIQTQLYEQETETGHTQLQLQQLELQLLSSCTQLRDHASENGGWTEQHEVALEAVGNCLIDDMNWDEEDVHRYMKDLVESIDGFEYGP